ncbi:MAG TPA: hypothetical protein VL096_22005 [Pirellulaceae bacterium]|nr:hypothetical protein [Pirellulaceae bacterium]
MPAFTLLLALSCAAPAVHAQPALQSAVPSAATPGKTVEIVLHGQKLDEPLRVWTSFPAQVQVQTDNPPMPNRTQVKLQVTIDAATPAQVGGLIVSTPAGVSEPLFFMVDDLPSSADNGKNGTWEQAQELTLPIAIDGATDAVRSDFYRFTATAGQKLSLDIYAARFGSALDPIVRLLDADRRELIVADDDAANGADGRFTYTFATAGSYTLELRDVRYRGGPTFRYRLRLGDFPNINTPFPLGLTQGQSGKLAFAGIEADALAPLDLAASNTLSQRQAVAVKANGGQASAFATLVTSAQPQAVEAEPNDTPETATKVTLPCGISGRFASDKDRDQYTFDAAANTTYTFRAITRSVGSPCYLTLAIYKPDGGLLIESPVNDTDEPAITTTFAAAGTYRLVVDDLLRRGGPAHSYYVEAALHAGFAPFLKPDKATPSKLQLAKNGAIAVEVQAGRSGYTGPITLTLEPSNTGITLLNNVIAANQPATRLYLIAPATLNPADLHALRIIGTGEHQGQKPAVPLSTAALLRLKSPSMAYPPAWLDGLVPVAITTEAPQLYAVTPSSPQIFYPQSAALVVFTLNLERKQAEFKDPLTVWIDNLPAGVTSEIKREGNGPQEKYNITLKGPKDLAIGQQELRINSYGELKGQGQLVTTIVPWQVIAPLTITLTPSGPIAPGQKQIIKVAVTRFNPGPGEDKQPITIKWKKLPPGVTAPGDATIAADQTEVAVELTAAADAAIGAFDGVLVEALTKFQGQDVVSESAATKWEVK